MKSNLDGCLIECYTAATQQRQLSTEHKVYNMSTQTATVFPIVGALREAVRFKKASDESWQPLTESQKTFVQNVYRPVLGDMSKFSDNELRYLASFSHEEINTWLKDNGFDIKLEPFQRPTDFGAASIQDVKVEWQDEGTKVEVPDAHNRSLHKGVKLKSNVTYVQDSSHDFPVAVIQTKNGDIVKMTCTSDNYVSGMQVLEDVVLYDRIAERTSFDSISFPMIDLEDKPNISFLKGMRFSVNGEDMEIAQAIQQTFFKMNEKGARVKSAVAIGVRVASISMPKPQMIIDRPFLLWISRPGTSSPYFAAYLDRDCWRDPGSLKMPGDKEEGTQE